MPGARGLGQIRMGAFEFSHLVADDAVFEEHHHARPHLVMVYSGVWNDRNGKGPIQLGAGSVLFHPAHFVHSTGATAPNTEVVIMRVDMDLVNAFCPLYGNVARDVRVPFESLRGVPDRIREELLDPDDAAPVLLESLAMQMLALGSRTQTPGSVLPPIWFGAAMTYLRQSYKERVTAQTIAAHIGVSASRVAHVFRDVMGRSIADYLRECRVRAAAKALRETDTPIGDIAMATGFYDQAHLTRAFKALRNMTPLQYRRHARSRVTSA